MLQTASTQPLLATWLNWQFTNQPASYASSDTSIVCHQTLCACTHLVRVVFLLCCTISLEQSLKVRSSNILASFKSSLKSHLFKLSCWLCVWICGVCVCGVCVHMCKCVFTVLVLCFVMGYVFQFGEIAHERVRYYCSYLHKGKFSLFQMQFCWWNFL